MVDPLFNSFATAAFLEFVIFAIFEMRLLLMIWRVRRQDAPDPWAQQRELSILYARFYSALLGGIFVSYQLQRCAALPTNTRTTSCLNRSLTRLPCHTGLCR